MCFFENWQQFSSVQSLSRAQLFVTPWTAARQASLSITNSRSLLKLMSIESVMSSNHLILCHPLLLLPSIFPSIRYSQLASLSLGKWKMTQVPVGASLEESTMPSTFQTSSSDYCLKSSIKQGWPSPSTPHPHLLELLPSVYSPS